MTVPGKKVAIVQSCYIPWKGYFDLIAAVDEFIFYDDMQFTRRDWRSRNRIKTPQGPQWLTVPVKVKGKYHQAIRETEIDGTEWARKHWSALGHNYRKAPYFTEVMALLEPFYREGAYTMLSELNRAQAQAICLYLGITTTLSASWDYAPRAGKTERLVDLCLQAGGGKYISGPAAKDYILPELFAQAGLELSWFDYGGYPAYPQLWGEFVHEVSIVDLLMQCGPQAKNYMKHV